LEGKLKKQLLTSTALVAAGAFAFAGQAMAQKMSKPTLTLSGWDEQIIGFANNDKPSTYTGAGNGFDAQTDSEIHFNGSSTLDNGIKVQFRVELEGNTSTDMIDENWMRVSGSFGQIQVGSTDNAAQQMTTGYLGAWSTGVGQNLAFDVGDWIEQPTSWGYRGQTTATTAGSIWRLQVASTDTEKINYFTPRFEGFQLGASYIPGGSQDVNNTPATKNSGQHGGYTVGANFVRKFGEIGLGIAGGYGEAKDAGQVDNNKVWGGGIRVDFAGFRVAFGYVGQQTPTAGDHTSGHDYDAGIRYTFGPNAVSLTGQKAKQETAVNGPSDKITQAMLSYRRTLGPGVNWLLNGMYAKYDGAASAGHLDNKGTAITTSIKVNF
jgi:hypothetical protein